MVRIEDGKFDMKIISTSEFDATLEMAVDMHTIICTLPRVLKEYPNVAFLMKSDEEVLQAMLDLGHIVAG